MNTLSLWFWTLINNKYFLLNYILWARSLVTELDSGWCNKRKELIFISIHSLQSSLIRGLHIINLALAVMCVGTSAVTKGNEEELWSDLILILSSGGVMRIRVLKSGWVAKLSSIQAGVMIEVVKGGWWISAMRMHIGKWNFASFMGECPSGLKQESTEGYGAQGRGKLGRWSESQPSGLGGRERAPVPM